MLFERIKSQGLAHYSYLIGDQAEAVVIDPRRDCDVYLDLAARAGYRITRILETHRNEDYVIGSCELAARTDAEIWHADAQLDYEYGQAVEAGQTWPVGRYSLKALHTPGHTPGSMSYLLHNPDGHPWAVFTGDVLFAGDVGRVDLLGEDRMPEMAAMLHASIFETLLPLGDGVLLCPAHGAGSVCGSTIAERAWTTLGWERQYNPRLGATDEASFVENVAEVLERPPYFRRMEKLNVEGPPILGPLPVPTPLAPPAFTERADEGRVVDTRSEMAFGSAHVPAATFIWQEGLASFAGWFLPYDTPLLLVNEQEDPVPVVRRLIRLGYDDLGGYLAGGMLSWHMAGRASHAIETMMTGALCDRIDAGEDAWVLDVRSDEELAEEGRISEAQHIHLTQLPDRLDEVPQDRHIYVFCGSGLRSMVAASLLRRSGWKQLTVILGGLKAWRSTACPVELASL